MAKFSQDNPPIRVLMIDAHATGFNLEQFPWQANFAFFKSLGCHVEWANAYDISDGDQVFQDEWDLIVVPWIGNTVAQYSNLKTQLAKFVSLCPVWYAQVQNAASGTAQPTTGVTALNATGEYRTDGLENWEGRQAGSVSFYGDAPTIAGAASVTIHARDTANDAVMLWSNTVESHPCLFMAAYNSQSGTIAKPWLGAQWMIDQCPDATRKAQIKAKIKKRYCLLRWDALGKSIDNDTYTSGHFQTAYDTLASYGVTEIWLAAYWASAGSLLNLPDTAYPDVANWFVARDKSNGGLFRCMNHETDIVNGTAYTPDERCTTDSVSADNFKAAATTYEAHCDQLTDFGFELGTDGYGKGIPNIQDGNDMNNPAAAFLTGSAGVYDTDGFYGGYGAYLWVSGQEDYPTGVTPQASIRHSIKWGEKNTLIGYSQDTFTSVDALDMSVHWNVDVLRCFINGGGIYYHGGATSFFLHDHADEFGQLFTSCPDILASGPFEDMAESLEAGTGVWFDS